MIDRQQLLTDLKPLLRELEADLRARCDEVAEINTDLTKEYEQARAANRAGITFEEWRADLITQVAVAWLLSSVFVRFLEDNALISPSRISGPLHDTSDGQGLLRARDERDLFFRSHPKQTDRDYLLAVFNELAKLPGTKDVFGPHNPVSVYRDWLSGDAAQKLIELFQKIDADSSGEIIHDFTDGDWDTRFLGDLYQDLSEAARKKYALLQTPIFVEEFILDRTLEPAISEFGLKDLKMIDPACGSGHFLLGSFARILKHWRKAEPGTNDRELVNRAMAAVHGVDLNPYAVAIARFRLLLAAMKECRVTQLKDAPSFQFNLACGDSLLHGSSGQQVLSFHELAHNYESEDIDELRRILKPGQYHAVVANPPYITVKDRALNEAYRERYPRSCHMKYSLALPFSERFFELAISSYGKTAGLSGYIGTITANSFMKREFGKKLIEEVIPKHDLTHVIDTSLAYIPGHTTSTVILLARARSPISQTVRTVMGIRGEDSIPSDPSRAPVWTAICSQLDEAGSESEYVSVVDLPRTTFHVHPWALRGGGALDVKAMMEDHSEIAVTDRVIAVGPMAITGLEEPFVGSRDLWRRLRIPCLPYLAGDAIRDWSFDSPDWIACPYDESFSTLPLSALGRLSYHLWAFRESLQNRVMFGKLPSEAGVSWYEYRYLERQRANTSPLVLFPCVATHNHFTLLRQRLVANQHASVLRFQEGVCEDDIVAICAVLNSSAACFWFKQVMSCKGLGGQGGGIKPEEWHRAYEFDSTKVKSFPLPTNYESLGILGQRAAELSSIVRDNSPFASLLDGKTPDATDLGKARAQYEEAQARLVGVQEEIDWLVYSLFGIADEPNLLGLSKECSLEPSVRPVEQLLKRAIANGFGSIYYDVHQYRGTPAGTVALSENDDVLIKRRREAIEHSCELRLVETVNYKRRWQVEPWEQQQEKALRSWLLDRLESYFDLDGRMNDQKTVTAKGNLHEPRLTSVGKVADLAKQDKDFMQVADLYTGRMDFDVANLVGNLVAAESIPCLPALRYKPTGLDKRAAWERTWKLQRLEDAVDALFDVERLKKIEPGKANETLGSLVAALRIDEQVKPEILREAVSAASYVAEATKQRLDPLSLLTDAAKRAKKRAVGNIAIPPKYTSADFLSSDFWRLRGKLDVPKERWVSFPHCEGEDGTLVITWAGYDHLQLARAIAERYEHAKEHEGRKLIPLLACIGQLIPWLKQWHNELDPAFGTRMGDYFENYLAEEAKALGMSLDQVMAWTPPEQSRGRGRRRRSAPITEA